MCLLLCFLLPTATANDQQSVNSMKNNMFDVLIGYKTVFLASTGVAIAVHVVMRSRKDRKVEKESETATTQHGDGTFLEALSHLALFVFSHCICYYLWWAAELAQAAWAIRFLSIRKSLKRPHPPLQPLPCTLVWFSRSFYLVPFSLDRPFLAFRFPRRITGVFSSSAMGLPVGMLALLYSPRRT